MDKKCTKCKTIKPLEEFYRDKKSKDGYTSGCIICSEKFRRQPTVMFRQSFNRMYFRVRARKNYKGRRCDITWSEFQKLYPDFLKLHQIWVKNKYNRSYAPSIDRIDNSKGYTIDNIQVIALGRNTSKDQTGSKHNNTKLLEFQVETIRWLYKHFNFTYKQLGRLFGISKLTVGNIIRRETWVHV